MVIKFWRFFFVWFSFSFQILNLNLQFANNYKMHINYQRRKKNPNNKTQTKIKKTFLNKIQNQERSKYIFTQYLFATPKTKSTCRYKIKSSYSRVIMNVRQNLFLTFSKKKKKKKPLNFLRYVFCHFARMSPSRRGPVFAVIYHGLYCLYLPRFRIKSPQFRYSVPHVFSPSFFFSLSLLFPAVAL